VVQRELGDHRFQWDRVRALEVALDHVRHEQRGSDLVHANALLAHLGRRRACQVRDGRLAQPVDGLRRRGDEADTELLMTIAPPPRSRITRTRHVGAHKRRLAVGGLDLPDNLGAFRLAPADRDDLCSGLGESDGRRAPDSARRSDHDRNLAVEGDSHRRRPLLPLRSRTTPRRW
jgi:hypothetical protein